jgi:hypothetical protein
MPRTKENHSQHCKAKKSYSLSRESVEFLEAIRKKRQVASISAILEEILQNVRREHEQASIERAVAEYYASFSDQVATEQAAWGGFAEQEFPNEERA